MLEWVGPRALSKLTNDSPLAGHYAPRRAASSSIQSEPNADNKCKSKSVSYIEFPLKTKPETSTCEQMVYLGWDPESSRVAVIKRMRKI